MNNFQKKLYDFNCKFNLEDVLYLDGGDYKYKDFNYKTFKFNEDVIKQFTQGSCNILVFALKEFIPNCKIYYVNMYCYDKLKEKRPFHYFIEINNNYVDITGIWNKEEYLKYWNYAFDISEYKPLGTLYIKEITMWELFKSSNQKLDVSNGTLQLAEICSKYISENI